MQLFIDNWSATLLAPATDTAVSLSVEPAKAALLTGLGTGDFYRLTLVDVDPSGTEIDWDVVEVTAVAAGVLTVTRTGTARSWAEGALIEARLTAEGMGELRDTAGGAAVGSDMPQALGSASPGASAQASRQDHVHPAPSPGDIGAATAAQGAKADTAVQPAALTAALADKVDKVAGKGLSSNDYTTAEKNKLAGLESSHFKGLHASLAALQSAHPSAVAGDYADVDAGAGVDVVRYLWDVTDSEWVAQAASGGSMTAAQVKTAYESNPDTNAFTDAEQAKLGGIAAGATANADTDSLAEGATNKYFTEGRVRSTVMTGLSLLTGGVISAADSVLSALGKLQNQISDAVTAIGGKQDALVSGTTLKTVNGNSLLGSGDLAISGSGGLANLVEANTATAPNATVPVVSLSVSVTEANCDYALVPKGTGAILGAIPNGAASGGNKRGTRAVDFQLVRSTAAQVASGANAVIVGGENNTASGAHSVVAGGSGNTASSMRSVVGGGISNTASGGNDVVAGGLGNTSSGGQNAIGGGNGNTAAGQHNTIAGGQNGNTGTGSWCFIGGGSGNTTLGAGDYRSHLGGLSNTATAAYASTTGGRQNVADGQYAVTLGGYQASTKGITGAVVHASGQFASVGDAQAGRYTLRIATSGTTPAVLTADASATPAAANSITLGSQNAYAIRARVIARNTANGECAVWEVTALARRTNTASTIALVGTPTITSLGGDAALSSASVAVSANTTLGSVAFTVTGIASTNLRWVALVETVEVG